MGRAGIALALHAACGLAAFLPAQKDTMDRMERLSKGFLALQTALSGSDEPVQAADAKALARLLAGIDAADDADHERLARRAREAADTLAEHLEKRERELARIALEDLRARCITCLVVQRKDEKRGSAFPAQGNTLWGRVRLQDRDGRDRSDADGVVLFVQGVDAAAVTRTTTIPPRMSQKGQRFSPSVLPVVVGTEVAFPNDDRVFHNVFSRSRIEPFDLDVYGKGVTKDQLFDQTGLVRIYCNIHPDMAASILVLGNPLFAVTEPDGLYVITGIPDGGGHELRLWHELGGEQKVEVGLQGGAALRRDFTVRETKRRLPHKNKFGRPYSTKY